MAVICRFKKIKPLQYKVPSPDRILENVREKQAYVAPKVIALPHDHFWELKESV